MNKIRKTFFQCAVEFRRNMNSRSFLQTGKTALIASGYRSENLNSQRETSILDSVNKRAGKNKMTSEAHGFFKANICRTGAVMAQDDVAKLTGKTAPDRVKRKILIICDNIFYFFTAYMEGDSILILTEHGNKFIPLYTGVIGQFSKRHSQYAGS